MSSFDIRVVAYNPGGSRIGPIDVFSIDATLAHSDAPAFSAKLSEETLASLPAMIEVALEYWHPADAAWVEPDDCRFLAKEGEGDDKDPAGMRTITGVGLWAWMMTKNVIAVGEGGVHPDYEDGHRPFIDALPGAIVKTFLDEGKARGWGAFLDIDFTHTHDSDGVPWAEAYTIAYKPGITTWLALSNLADQAIIEFATSGRTLHMYRPDRGQDRSLGNAPTRIGNAAVNMPVKTSIDDLITHVTVYGENAAVWEFTDGATNLLGRLEGAIQQGGVSRPGTAAKMASSTLTDGKQIKRQITASENALTTPSLPFIDYVAGDWVLARVDDANESLRVMEIQIRKGQTITIDTVLNDRFIDLLARTAKRANGILGGTSAGGTGVPPEKDDIRVPKVPQGVLATSEGYWTADGRAASSLAVRWIAVTQGTDNVDLHQPTYELWWREDGQALDESRLLGTVSSGTFGATGYAPGSKYFIKVRALSAAKIKKAGEFSPEVPVIMATPIEKLDPPTVPTVLSTLGVITVRWDGQLIAGGTIMDLPPQFRHVYVSSSLAEGGPYSMTGQVLEHGGQQAVIAGVDLGTTLWFRFTAVDTRGVESDPSLPASVLVTGIDLGSLEDDVADATEAAKQAGIDGKAAAEKAEAAAVAARAALPKIVATATGSTFYNPLTWGISDNAMPGDIVIDTGITFGSYMTRVKIAGYNYQPLGATSIDLDIGFYAYSVGPAFINTSQTSFGSKPVTVRLARKTATNTVSIILTPGAASPLWYYPKLAVTEVILGQSTVPDSMYDGWAAAVRTDLSAYSLITTPPARDLNDTHGLTQGWRTTGQTTIDGGKITADSVTAGQIKAGAVGTDELAANSVNAGKIDALAVTAGKLAADSVLAANIKAGEVTAGKLAANSIVAGNIQTDAVTANAIKAGAVTATALSADAINGKVITGVDLRGASISTTASPLPGNTKGVWMGSGYGLVVTGDNGDRKITLWDGNVYIEDKLDTSTDFIEAGLTPNGISSSHRTATREGKGGFFLQSNRNIGERSSGGALSLTDGGDGGNFILDPQGMHSNTNFDIAMEGSLTLTGGQGIRLADLPSASGVAGLVPVQIHPTTGRLYRGNNDTGWIDLVLSSGSSAQNNLTPQIRRLNGVTYVRGRVLQNNAEIAVIPSGFRPSQDLRMPTMSGSFGSNLVVVVATWTGSLFTSAGMMPNLSLSWPADY